MVREAASEIVQNVERVRSEAKRLNATRRLYVATGSDYSMRDSSGNVISPFSVLPGVTIVRISQSQSTTNLGSATMDFKAPYGTRDTPAVSYDIIVQAASNNTVTRTIRIIGPLGKVYVL